LYHCETEFQMKIQNSNVPSTSSCMLVSCAVCCVVMLVASPPLPLPLPQGNKGLPANAI
jgi:hypothetical protein